MTAELPPRDAALALRHLDEHCIAIVKPAGMLSVPGRVEPDCAFARLRQRFADALVVHRLDMATSGLLLFARGAEAQRRLSRAFAEREIDKRYIAVVHGRIVDDAGRIELPLAADWPNRPKQRVDLERGKPSLTHYRVLHRDPEAATTRVELQPVTGRSHQLRVHLRALGHPILGDALYAPAEVRARAERLLLHCSALDFPHPFTGARLQLDAAAPF